MNFFRSLLIGFTGIVGLRLSTGTTNDHLAWWEVAGGAVLLVSALHLIGAEFRFRQAERARQDLGR